jgi:hypothetical protein
MKLKVYAIFDSASGVYDGPFKARGHGEIIRMFSDLAVSADHPIGKHPEHFSLYFIGEFDDTDAVLEKVNKQVMVTGEEAVAQSRKIAPGSLKDVNSA